MEEKPDKTPENPLADDWRRTCGFLPYPEIRPLCSDMRLMDSGNRMVHVFPFADVRDDSFIPAAAIGVFRVSFVPDKPEDATLLANHVRNALKRLADIEPEFYRHADYCPYGSEYIRPERQPFDVAKDKDILNVYVYVEDGEVIVANPLILSDAMHLFDELEDVLIPSEKTAIQFEQARWNELRGPISSLDRRLFGDLCFEYSFEALPAEQQIGCMPDVEPDEIVTTALQHALALHLADLSTQEEMAAVFTGLARSTAYGLLEDGSGRYPALPAPAVNRAPEQIREEHTRAITERATDMLAYALAMTKPGAGQALPAPAIGAELHDENDLREDLRAAVESLGPQLRARLEDGELNPYMRQRGAQVEERVLSDFREAVRKAAEPSSGTSPFNRWAKASREETYARWEAIGSQALEDKKNREKALSERHDGYHEAQEIPFFIPRRYVWENSNWRGEKATYISRPPGPAYPPALDLPEKLKPFIDLKDQPAPAPASAPAPSGSGPTPG